MLAKTQRPKAWIAATVAALLVIAMATLVPRDEPLAAEPALCLVCGELGTLDLIWNVALFAPFGAFLAWQASGVDAVARGVLWSLTLSLAVEVAQLTLVAGRDPSLADVAANTLGGALGAGAVLAMDRLRDASSWVYEALAWALALVSAFVLAFGAWAMKMQPTYEPHFVQWAVSRRGYEPFRGKLASLSLNGLTLHPAQQITPRQLPQSFLNRRVTLEADISPGPRPAGIALIARLAVVSGEVLMVGREYDALVARYRSNAYLARLRSPVYALANALSSDPAMDTRVQVDLRDGAMDLRAVTASRMVAQRQRITTARLWATLLPFEHGFGTLGVVGDLVWLAALMAPVAYASGRTARMRGIVPALTLIAFLAALAFTYQAALWWWPYWTAVILSGTLALWLGRSSRRRRLL